MTRDGLRPHRRRITPLTCGTIAVFTSAANAHPLRSQAGYWQEAFAPDRLPEWLLALLGLAGLGVAIVTLVKLVAQTRAAVEAANAARTSADAVMLAERAYISISHHPPGLTVGEFSVTEAGDEHFGGWHDAAFAFAITNLGNTPATITSIAMGHEIAHPDHIPLPPSGPGTGEWLYLVKGEMAHDERRFQIKASERDQLGLTLRLWMMGHVDYIDTFGVRRRAGYARFYDPSKDQESGYENQHGQVDRVRYDKRSNLPFVTRQGYNYDRKREPGEGLDWSEPT